MKMSKLLALALVLLISVGTLAGSTIAWFTDEVTSANNIIKSGTLDLVVNYKAKYADTWQDLEESTTPLFSHDLWEPGYTAYKFIQLKNEGSLAFKYQLNMKADVDSTAAFKLADVIDVYMLDASVEPDRASFTDDKKVGTLSALMADEDGAAYGVILPKGHDALEGAVIGSTEVCIGLKMQESAGNDYQGLSIGSNDGIAIEVLATQYTYEEDSFGNQYDEDSETVSSGTAGDISWDLNVDGTLAISGTGALTADNIQSLPDKDQITNVKIGSGITEIGEEAFRGLNISAVTFEDESQLKVIGVNAFRDCTAMETFYVPASVEKICEKAFQGCASLETVTFEANSKLKAIGVDGEAGKNAFANCTSLKSVVLPDSVETIGVACFYGCTNLETVVLGDNVSSIGISAFENSGLTAFEVPAALTVIPNGMLNNTKITTITVGDQVTTVNPGAFANCTELKTAYIGSATVKASVFDGCSNLETVIFANVTDLDGWAFMNCTNLKTVVINAANNLTLGYNTYTTGEKAKWYGNTYYSATGNVITYIASDIAGEYSAQCENCLLGHGWNDGTADGTDILAYTNGGTFAKDTTFVGGTLATPTKAGYVFGGWYTESDFSGTAVTTAEAGQIYYAKWIAE